MTKYVHPEIKSSFKNRKHYFTGKVWNIHAGPKFNLKNTLQLHCNCEMCNSRRLIFLEEVSELRIF